MNSIFVYWGKGIDIMHEGKFERFTVWRHLIENNSDEIDLQRQKKKKFLYH